MRKFKDGDELWLEPWRAKAFPVIKDLTVDRSAFDRIIQAGGFVSVRTGSAPDANAIPVPKPNADMAMDAAQCIGCGACVAACPNASAMLFTSAKVSHLALCPRASPSATSAPVRWSRADHGRRGLRRLHQPRRVRGRPAPRDQDSRAAVARYSSPA
jgi:succinate dehydrogenase/fumarate reductase-like Fe-S protein